MAALTAAAVKNTTTPVEAVTTTTQDASAIS